VVDYTPKAGTVAQRALAHLESLPDGAELMSSALGAAISAPHDIRPYLEAAEKHGLLFKRQRDTHPRSPFFWSLTDHTKKPKAPWPEVPTFLLKGNGTPNTPPQGANRDASAEQSHGAAGSASPRSRGTNGAPARGAAPVFPDTPALGSQHVLKAEAARPDATDREIPASPSKDISELIRDILTDWSAVRMHAHMEAHKLLAAEGEPGIAAGKVRE